MSQWAPTITALIAASQNLRVAAAMEEDDIQSRLSSLQNLKHFVWIMSEYLGRERAAVAALVAAGKPMNSQEISNLADIPRPAGDRLGLRAGVCHKIVGAAKCRGRHRARARECVPPVRGDPQGRLCGGTCRRQLSRQFSRMVRPGDKGDRRRDRAQRDRKPGSGKTGRNSQGKQPEHSAGEWRPDGFLVSFLRPARSGSYSIASSAPSDQMTGAMSEIADGNTSVAVPCVDRRDEMGAMARALLVFKENAEKVQAMQAERAALEKAARAEKTGSNEPACR